jgi:hypothetical protein
MPATVTLAGTTLAAAVGTSDTQIKVDSTSGLTPGTHLYVDRELMSVVGLGSSSTWVNVKRGVGATATTPHSSGVPVVIGRADQFFMSDPVGLPDDAVLVSPYINVLTGDYWLARGDTDPKGLNYRWWQKAVVKYDFGALGIRTVSIEPTTSE